MFSPRFLASSRHPPSSGLGRFLICNLTHVMLIDPAYACGVYPVTQIMDGNSDILPRVLPQPSNFVVRSRHPVIPNSLNSTGGSGPSPCQTTFSHRWTSPRKDGRMIRPWPCSNTESSVNENRVRTSEIFDNLAVWLIRVSRLVVSP